MRRPGTAAPCAAALLLAASSSSSSPSSSHPPPALAWSPPPPPPTRRCRRRLPPCRRTAETGGTARGGASNGSAGDGGGVGGSGSDAPDIGEGGYDTSPAPAAAAAAAKKKKKKKKSKLEAMRAGPAPWSVPAVLAAAFLNLLGFTMAGPINPALGRHFNLDVGASFGSLTSAYPLGMLFGLFLWPQLSDRAGRKPVMAASLLGSGLGLAAQSHAVRSGWGLRQFLAVRVVTGSFAGSSPVSKAYLADLGMAAGSLPRYLAWRDAASTLSFIVGPALGGLFFEARRTALKTAKGADVARSLAFVIGISSAASLAAAALVSIFVREIPRVSERAPTAKGAIAAAAADDDNDGADEEDDDAADDDGGHVSCPLGRTLWTGVATVCVVSFLFNVGDSTFHAFFPALMRDRLGLDARAIGLAFTAFACVSFLVSTAVTGNAVKTFGPVPTCGAGLVCVGAGLIGLAAGAAGTASPASAAAAAAAAAAASAATSMAPAMAFSAAALYYCGVPLYGPTIPTMLLRCVPPSRRGAVMGLDGAINTVARVISPLAVGELYRRRGPAAAFGFAGGAALSAAAIAAARRVWVMRNLGVVRGGGGGGGAGGGGAKR